MWNVQQCCKRYSMRKVSLTQTYPESVSDSQIILPPADFSWMNITIGKNKAWELLPFSFLQVLWHGYIGLTNPQGKCWTPKLRKGILFVMRLSKTSVVIHGFANMVYPVEVFHIFFFYPFSFTSHRVHLSLNSRPTEL